MARVSTKENKNIYQLTREGLKLTRDAASELLESIPPERIEKIENERSLPHPDEVLTMADKYKKPDLCNYYCANQCPIGQEYVPEIKIKDLSQIVLETDCPYMAPEPNRGRRNSSLNLPYVAEALAQIKGITAEEVIAVTEENAKRLLFRA